MIVDANIILRAFFPDETQAQAQALVAEHAAGRVILEAPSLLLYEFCNAVRQAERRGRIQLEQADRIIETFEGLDIQLHPMEWGQMLPLARRFDRSAYDASYLALAESLRQSFITGDERLYNAVHRQLKWVIWIGDYSRS
jgi:predicted nucleic acid-binding protein